MRSISLLTLIVSIIVGLSSCSPKISTRLTRGSGVEVKNKTVSINRMTMDVDEEPIEYTINIATESGRAKLKNLSLEEAEDLALEEAIMSNKCAALFQPHYSHYTYKGKVLRVTVYGFPARYKKK